MTFDQFCTQEFIQFDILPIFRQWLGRVAERELSRDEWLKLWRQFVSVMIGSNDNGK